MKLNSAILVVILIEVAARCLVTGLQCYVCKDCNEHEDFKELHICGEIPDEMTMSPQTLAGGSTTRKPFRRTSVASFSKPSEKTTIDDYLYEDSDEKHDAQHNFNQTNATRIQTSTTSSITSTAKENLATQSSTTVIAKPTKTTNTGTIVTKEAIAITEASTSTTPVTTAKPLPDYDDYLEYDEPLKMSRSEAKALQKINEPVCYMIKFRANNTIITTRGCTTFINADKYLTCQTLYSGVPLETCRVCSSNGCNKFLDDDSYDDNYGVLFNAAADFQQFGISIYLLWLIISQAIIALA